MKTTRREFIKILTGTVIAVSLPIGLFSDKKGVAVATGTANYFKYNSEVEFILERIEIVPLITDFGWAVRGLGIPKNKKISPAYFAVRIDDIKDWGNKSFKKEVIEDIKFNLRNHFKNRRTI